MNPRQYASKRNLIGRLLDAAQQRFRSARPGSVLIMVVALLVLLALIGTAAMSTARIDRASSRQHVANTEIDMLAESLKQMVIGQLVNDLFNKIGPNVTDAAVANTDAPYTDTRDAILAGRLPERLWIPTTNLTPNDTIDHTPLPTYPIWRSPSYPPIQISGQYYTDPPDEGSQALPMPKVILQPVFKVLNGETLPAFIPRDRDGNVTLGRTLAKPFLAADTDGDGIADAILFRLPMSSLEGITYYGAIRVVDNGSAINLNTAWDPNIEVVTVKAGSSNVTLNFAGVFPASIALSNEQLNFIADKADFQKFHAQRLYGDWKQGTLIPPYQLGSNNPSKNLADTLLNPKPIGENKPPPAVPTYPPPQRTDFVWLTAGDAMHTELGRRLDFPGYWDNNPKALYGKGVRPFGIDAAMTLAYRFTLVNSAANDSLVESALPQTLLYNNGLGVANGNWKPYTDVDAWFRQNFDYPAYPSTTTTVPNYVPNTRALLTSLNPVRNDVVRHKQLFGNPNDPYDPFRFPSKTNPNTATFEELYQAFFDVMTEDGDSTPFDDDGGYRASLNDPYMGMKFTQGGNFANNALQHPARMFRSPIRGIGNGGALKTLGTMHPYQVMLMRAAVAAWNAKCMREQDKSNTPGYLVPHVKIALPEVNLPGGGKAPKFNNVHIYGVKRQPFITEVYLNNNPEDQSQTAAAKQPPPGGGQPRRNHRGFAAIELYNPYDTPLNLTGWCLKVIDRTKDITTPDGTAPGLRTWILGDNTTNTGPLGGLTPLDEQATTPFRFPGTATIPAGGFLIIWNYNGNNQNANDYDTAQYLPSNIPDAPAGVSTLYLKTLHQIIGREVVLMRPADDGSDAPVDSFDSSSMPKYEYDQAQRKNPVDAWHYVRANDTGGGNQTASKVTPGRAWNFVYPGRYDASSAANKRHQGTDSESWDPDPTKDEPWAGAATGPKPVIALGASDLTNSREKDQRPSYDVGSTTPAPTSSFAIQIANSNPQQQFTTAPPGSPPNMFPFGGFARAGDLMQVTFIAPYTIEEDVPDTTTGSPMPVFYEVNALPMDAAFAEDTDTLDDVDIDGQQSEEVGRFVPLLDELRSYRRTGTIDTVSGSPVDTLTDPARMEKDNFWNGYDVVVTSNDPNADPKKQIRSVLSFTGNAGGSTGTIKVDVGFDAAPATQVKKGDGYTLRYYRYGFATKIFDYFTTLNSAADDYTPNTDPKVHTPVPDVVANTSDTSIPANRTGLTAHKQTEDIIGAEGLININTANWKVLASLPLVLKPGGVEVDQYNTERLAKRIVYLRDVDDGLGIQLASGGPKPPHPHGPFKSVFELNILDEFATAEGAIKMSVKANEDPGTAYGDYSPITDPSTPGADNVRMDFEEKYANLIRLSNLLTTRSDSFTAYVQVQGWRDAGTPTAKLVAQRRLAFIVDRSRVTATKKVPAVYNVPTAN